MTRSIIIDCDPGRDDAIALIMAARSPKIEVVGVSTVFGNHDVETVTANVNRALTLANRTDIPVAKGSETPLSDKPHRTAGEAHGDFELAELPNADSSVYSDDGVEFLIDEIKKSNQEVYIAALGPLTNIATVISEAPEIADQITEIAFMGGSMAGGNITPAAEFNVYSDPEAAQQVINSDIPVTMIGLDVTHQSKLSVEEIHKLCGSSDESKIIADLLLSYRDSLKELFGWERCPVHDVCVIAYLENKDIIETEQMRVDIETEGKHTYGETVCDRYGSWSLTGRTAKRNVNVGIELDKEKLYGRLVSTFNEK